jgi:tetratricopeptide (TPR) repeat protein
VGVLHEVIICDEPHSTARLEGLTTQGLFDSARNTNPQKYKDDAALLEAALKSEPGNARYVFYLAQSYRDAGELAKSIEAYERRATLQGWDEEVWYSLYQAAVLRELLGQSPALVVSAFLRAYQNRPSRAEPLCALARYHREREQFAIAHVFASAAMQMNRPADILFLDDSVYDCASSMNTRLRRTGWVNFKLRSRPPSVCWLRVSSQQPSKTGLRRTKLFACSSW